MLTQTTYIEYLLSTPTNYTCTHSAAHLADMSHDQMNRFLCTSPLPANQLHELVQPLRRDSPEAFLLVDDTLLARAAAPFKALAGEVVFYNATQLVAHETIAFAAGQCVGYHETFESGAGPDGAYVCQLTITAPAFELRGGGPAATAVAWAIGGNGMAEDSPSPALAVGIAASAGVETAATAAAANAAAAATAAAAEPAAWPTST